MSVGPIQVPSNLLNVKTFPDVVRFLSAFTSQAASKFNALIAERREEGTSAGLHSWAYVNANGTLRFSSGSVSATLTATGFYSVFFGLTFGAGPAVIPTPAGASLAANRIAIGVVGATLGRADVYINDGGPGGGTPRNSDFMFIARGGT